jgi:exodeoxyribonuclease V alpha subunit
MGSSEKVRISGSVDLVTFRNDENGYTILKVTSKRGNRATVVGVLPAVSPGEEFEATGSWETSKFGKQFKADSFNPMHPSTPEGIIRFLGSGLIQGVGPAMAQTLFNTFKDGVFDALGGDVSVLLKVPGIGAVKAADIQKSWNTVKSKHEVLVFLYAHNVKPSAADKIYRRYGIEAISLLSADPYRVANDIDGIGFLTADAMASSFGIVGADPRRVEAGIAYALEQTQLAGNCGLPEPALIKDAAALLDLTSEIKEAVANMVNNRKLIADTTVSPRELFLPKLFNEEAAIAATLIKLVHPPEWMPNIENIKVMISSIEAMGGIQLAVEQRLGVQNGLTSRVSVVTGGPGTGKTTLVKMLMSILTKLGISVELCAPTGKAAIRLSESTGFAAATVHRLLGLNGANSSPQPINKEVVVLDEASMLDVHLMYLLTKSLSPETSLIIIGDADQIPSVGPGKVLDDVIRSGVIPVTKLTRIFRQGAGSCITEVAHAVNQGRSLSLKSGELDRDFLFIEVEDAVQTKAAILEMMTRTLPAMGFKQSEIQLLAPMRKGTLGINELNIAIKSALNPSPSAEITRFMRTFAVGDKVMQTRNDYDRYVFNGEVGKITQIELEQELVEVAFSGKSVVYPYADLDALAPAFASTIHKFQGSEEQAIVLVITSQHYPMLKRNLLYTGITRGRKMVSLIGSRKAISIAVATQDAATRCTRLKRALIEQHAALSYKTGNEAMLKLAS